MCTAQRLKFRLKLRVELCMVPGFECLLLRARLVFRVRLRHGVFQLRNVRLRELLRNAFKPNQIALHRGPALFRILRSFPNGGEDVRPSQGRLGRQSKMNAYQRPFNNMAVLNSQPHYPQAFKCPSGGKSPHSTYYQVKRSTRLPLSFGHAPISTSVMEADFRVASRIIPHKPSFCIWKIPRIGLLESPRL